MMYFQCALRKGNMHTTAWIEERGAKVGNEVEIKDWNETWEVEIVYTPAIEADDLKAKQELDRNCLPSLRIGA